MCFCVILLPAIARQGFILALIIIIIIHIVLFIYFTNTASVYFLLSFKDMICDYVCLSSHILQQITHPR